MTPNLKCYTWALKECQRYGEKWSKRWAHEPTLIRILAEVPEIMAHHAFPVNGELYPTWDRFLQDFLKRGKLVTHIFITNHLQVYSLPLLGMCVLADGFACLFSQALKKNSKNVKAAMFDYKKSHVSYGV